MDKRTLIFLLLITVSVLLMQNFLFDKHQTIQTATEEIVQDTQPISTNFQKQPQGAIPQLGSYYALENEFMQVVFSTTGGAITEINLPFQSKENTDSVVKPIGIDREIAKDSPENDLFPVYPTYSFEKNSQQPTLISPQQGGYYPLLRRAIKDVSGNIAFAIPPRHFSLNVYSEEDATQDQTYNVRRFEKDLIEFEFTSGSRKIIKTFSFPKEGKNAPYCLNCSVRIEGDARNLWLTSGTPEVELISGSFSPSLKYLMTRNSKSVIEQIGLPKNATTISSIHPNWVSNSNGFFGIILDPLSDIAPGFQALYVPGEADLTRLVLVDSQYNLYPAEKYPAYEFFLPLPSTNQVLNFRMFAGPLATDILKLVDATYTNPKTGYNPNYLGAQSFHGWFAFISEPFAKFLLFLMKTFHSFTHSWGFSIILLTIALRIMLYPLNAWAIKSQIRMQQLQPLVKVIQEKHKKDPKRANIEIMQLYREKKASPFTGCLPLFIQMPFLIGMFDLLKSTFELRGVSFIPGWINNLTAPDVLFSWGYPIPFLGTSFHLLPILLGVIMYFQQKLSAIQAKKKGPVSEQQGMLQKSGTIMTIVFTFMFYHFPSGLNIYWISSMLLSIVQQWITSKKLKAAAPAVEVQTPIKRDIKRKI